MGRLLQRAVEEAGLSELCERALAGRGLAATDLARLRGADVLVVAGLADAVRARFRGDEVKVLSADAARREAGLSLLRVDPAQADALTGQELLLEVALARLSLAGDQSLGVSFEAFGLQLAQTALAFGADALVGDLGSKRTLPLLDGAPARREELSGLIARAGRTARFVDPPALVLESRS